MKKRLCLVLITLLLSAIFLSACTPERIMEVTKFVDIKWTCDEPKIEIQILKENKGVGLGNIELDGVKKDIYFTWGFARFGMMLMSEYEPITNGEDSISGGFTPKDDSHVQLEITTDKLFNGKLAGRKIVITSTKINNAEVDAKVRHNVRWDSINPQISFELPQGKRKRAYGEIEKNNVKQNIAFIWLDDNKFEIYSFNDKVISEAPIMKGAYESSHLKIILTVTYDEIYDFKYSQIELNGVEITKSEND